METVRKEMHNFQKTFEEFWEEAEWVEYALIVYSTRCYYYHVGWVLFPLKACWWALIPWCDLFMGRFIWDTNPEHAPICETTPVMDEEGVDKLDRTSNNVVDNNEIDGFINDEGYIGI